MNWEAAKQWDGIVARILSQTRVIQGEDREEVRVLSLHFLAVLDDLAGHRRPGVLVEYRIPLVAIRRLLGSLPEAVVEGYRHRASCARTPSSAFWLMDLV